MQRGFNKKLVLIVAIFACGQLRAAELQLKEIALQVKGDVLFAKMPIYEREMTTLKQIINVYFLPSSAVGGSEFRRKVWLLIKDRSNKLEKTRLYITQELHNLHQQQDALERKKTQLRTDEIKRAIIHLVHCLQACVVVGGALLLLQPQS